MRRGMLRIAAACVFAACAAASAAENAPGGGKESRDVVTLTLDDCIKAALLYNHDIREAFISYRKTRHDVGIDRSRFLPSVDMKYEYSRTDAESTGTTTTSKSGSVTYSQRLLEFGKENSAVVSTRAAIREALYTLKNTIRDVISTVRRDFFFILLKQEQIRRRERLLKEFREDLLVARAKFAKGQILEIDVFTAELNVLNEELRLNELRRTLLKKKMDLRYTLGCRIPLHFALAGTREPLAVSERDAVEAAKRRSFYLEKLREEIAEKEREVAEKVWEYMPELTFRIGYENLHNSVAVNLNKSGYLWSVDLDAEGFFLPSETRRATFPDREKDDVSVSFQITLPLFDGFKRREEYAKQRKEFRVLQLGYRDAVNDLVRDVLKAYQDYYEQKERLEILRRRVEIARKRLKINEKLKEVGKIDDNQLETFRQAFFAQQEALYAGQDALIQAEENVRKYLFDPGPCLGILADPRAAGEELRRKGVGVYCEGVEDEK